MESSVSTAFQIGESHGKYVKTPRGSAVFSVLHHASTHSGANDVTRTHDLLITKCIRALRLAVFRAFEAFPPGILCAFRPICSIVSVRSFPHVGQRVGQVFSPYIKFSQTIAPSGAEYNRKANRGPVIFCAAVIIGMRKTQDSQKRSATFCVQQ